MWNWNSPNGIDPMSDINYKPEDTDMYPKMMIDIFTATFIQLVG